MIHFNIAFIDRDKG